MNKLFNKAVLNGTTIMGDGLTYPRIPNVYTGDNEGGYQRGDMMDANAVVKMIKELTDTDEITIEELQNLINEEIQERVEGDQDQQRYTDEKIKDLIGTSPETLDTLKEIADALGEDPDFAANVWEKLAEVDQTLEDYKRASNLPKYVVGQNSKGSIIDTSYYSDKVNMNFTGIDLINNLTMYYNFEIRKADNYTAGVMSSTDKAKLDTIENSAQVNKIESVSVNGTPLEITNKGIDIPYATSELGGMMSKADKAKLDSLENYTLPAATDTTLGGVKVPSTFTIPGQLTTNHLGINSEGNLILSYDLIYSYDSNQLILQYLNGTEDTYTIVSTIDCTKFIRKGPEASITYRGLMSKEDKAKLDSQPTIKASDATGVTDDDYVVIKKSEYQSILDRLSALEGS